TLVEVRDGDREAQVPGEEALPRGYRHRRDARARELFQQRLAATGRIDRDQDPARIARDEATEPFTEVLPLAAQRQHRRGLRAEFDAVVLACASRRVAIGRRRWRARDDVDAQSAVEPFPQLLRREVELARWQHGPLDVVRALLMALAGRA